MLTTPSLPTKAANAPLGSLQSGSTLVVCVALALVTACGGNKNDTAEPALDPTTKAARSDGQEGLAPSATPDHAREIPSNSEPVNPELAKEALAFLGRISDIIATNASDCELMASGLEEELASSKSVVDQVNAADSKKLGKYVEENHADELMASSKKMQSGMQNCQSNERVRAALSSLDN